MPEPILIHLPQHAKDSLLGRDRDHFYERLIDSFDELNLDFDVIDKKDKELRRDARFRHVLYHTRRQQPNVLNAKVSYLPGYYYLDPTGFSGWSSLTSQRMKPREIDTEAAKKFGVELTQEFIAPRRSKYAVEPTGDLPQRYTAIMLQVQDDAVLQLAACGAREMVKQTVKAMDGAPVVIKPHPLCTGAETSAICKEFALLPNVTIARGNVHDVLARADRVVTVNSGSGFEALMHGKPVILFGKSDYWQAARSWKGTDDVFSEPARSGRHIKKFLFWFLKEQMFHVGEVGFTQKLFRKLKAVGWL